jgi:hypothetical protein
VAEINKNNLRHLLDFSTKSRNNNPLNYITRRVKFKTLEIHRNKNAARKGNLGKFFRNRYTSNYYSTPPFFFYFTIFRSFFFFFMFRRNIFLFQAISSASIHAVRDGAETTTWFPSLK